MFELAEILTEQRQNVKLRFKKHEQFSWIFSFEYFDFQ